MFKGSHPRDRSPSLHCPGRPLGRGDRLRSHDVRNIHCRNRHRRTTGRHHTFNFCYLEQAYFLPVLKNSEQKKTSPEKNSRQILAKNSRYRSHLNISAKKLEIFSLSGTYFDRFLSYQIRFLRHILLTHFTKA